MRIASALVQHYFLEVDPVHLEGVAEILRGQERMRQTGAWSLFSWLDRPAIWAMREIERTSGLDMFLFDDDGLAGVTDVAELITFPVALAGGCLQADWTSFTELLKGDGVLFATFLWPDWDTLCSPLAWGGRRPPKRTEILGAIHRCLLRALPKARERGWLAEMPPLLLTASAGDADLILYGWIRNSTDLDAILLALSLMDTAVLAEEIFGALGPVSAAWPVFRSTQTELAISLDLYLEVRAAARVGRCEDEGLQGRLNGCFAGDLFAEIGLARGRGPLGDLKDGLRDMAPQWEERAVFGGEDLVLAAAGGEALSFGNVVVLLARLEVLPVERGLAGFPRRSSLRLGVMDAMGRQTNFTVDHIYGPTRRAKSPGPPPNSFKPTFPSADLSVAREKIKSLSQVRWREDVRIIERMIERCVTLQKSHSLRRETRRMVSQALTRIVKRCRDIRDLEETLDIIIKESQVAAAKVEAGAGAAAEAEMGADTDWYKQIRETSVDIRRRRSSLLSAGMALDRALSHHSKGVVALLLHPASQARGSEHIASEVGLSLGMGAMFQSAARRVLAALPAGGDTREDEANKILYQLKDGLRDIQHPTVYASHDPDFSINAGMALLRIPRWALWYPSASSHLMHEFGHALASIGGLSYLLSNVLFKVGGQGELNSGVMQAHLAVLDPVLEAEKEAVTPAVQRLVTFVTKTLLRSAPKDGKKAKAKAKKELTWDIQPGTLDEMEEICCDVVARSLAYPPGPEWDRRWLVETFDYSLPFAGRKEPDFIQTRFLRLLAAFVVVRLLRTGLSTSGDADAEMPLKSLAAILEEMNVICGEFGLELEKWGERLQGRGQELPSYVSNSLLQVITSLQTLVREGIFNQTARETWFMYASILISLALSLKPVTDQNEVSGFKVTQIWGRLIELSRLRQTGQAEESSEDEKIVEALADNEIPVGTMKHIEYLPSLLANRYERLRDRVPPSVRIALSYYLYDNYEFDS